MRELREIQRGIAETQSGLTKILIETEENPPTILKRLMAIENKVDSLIERDRA